MRSVSHSLLAVGAYDEAISLTNDAATYLEPQLSKPSAALLSVHGTAMLVRAMAAARNDDRDSARGFLTEAQADAGRLGQDENRMWTAFGLTNVAIHRVSTAMELGDVQIALDVGPKIDTSALPSERRVGHALEVARALSAANRRDDAITAVLEAERSAPEQVRYHFLSRHLVQIWVRAQKTKPSYELSELAKRLHVA